MPSGLGAPEQAAPSSRVRLLRKERRLGFLPLRRETEVEASAVEALESAFRQAGIPLSPHPAV
jgi:hypothetical protein